MRVLISLLAGLLLASCGSSEPEKRQAELNEIAVTQAVNAQTEAQAGISAIDYPDCATVWKDGKVTNCGRKTFELTMRECQRRAQIAGGAGSSLLDEYAGPSWVQAAGATAVMSTTDRLAYMKKSGRQDSFEVVAVALGNGTSAIERYNCEMQDLRLKDVSWFGRENVF